MSSPAISGPTILTRSGQYFSYLDPAASTYDMFDIAHALSNICRFCGHSRSFYSVAEHSVHVSQLVPKRLAFAALMHDAAEAFVGDMPKPLKEMLPEYSAIERRIEDDIARRFDLGDAMRHPEVKRADRIMLRTEQRQVMDNSDGWSWCADVEPASIIIEFLTPDRAASRFLARAMELQAGIRQQVLMEAGR